MELEDEQPPQINAAEADAAGDEANRQADANRSDGEALALHEI